MIYYRLSEKSLNECITATNTFSKDSDINKTENLSNENEKLYINTLSDFTFKSNEIRKRGYTAIYLTLDVLQSVLDDINKAGETEKSKSKGAEMYIPYKSRTVSKEKNEKLQEFVNNVKEYEYFTMIQNVAVNKNRFGIESLFGSNSLKAPKWQPRKIAGIEKPILGNDGPFGIYSNQLGKEDIQSEMKKANEYLVLVFNILFSSLGSGFAVYYFSYVLTNVIGLRVILALVSFIVVAGAETVLYSMVFIKNQQRKDKIVKN
ncbi:hypothetical protein BB559_004134 [Furculomyces boomerangus]|uniref:Uncharacterized protein n=1 Tax=Furculomyces boomerangus TaxID=61424 RepID=A0A2T9YGP2_9FUNG|nr:hypothetical protein BB559_004134 [Furculomyces boomerangus]